MQYQILSLLLLVPILVGKLGLCHPNKLLFGNLVIKALVKNENDGGGWVSFLKDYIVLLFGAVVG